MRGTMKYQDVSIKCNKKNREGVEKHTDRLKIPNHLANDLLKILDDWNSL